jgi:hypothetical protein
MKGHWSLDNPHGLDVRWNNLNAGAPRNVGKAACLSFAFLFVTFSLPRAFGERKSNQVPAIVKNISLHKFIQLIRQVSFVYAAIKAITQSKQLLFTVFNFNRTLIG